MFCQKYTFFGNENNNWTDVILTDYLVFDLETNYQLFNGYKVSINIGNILNEEYEQAYQYSSMERTFNFGVISIPSFYMNFEDAQKGIEDYKSVTRDVKYLLDSLSEETIDGIIIDLRNNGGGSLQEAIDLTGLLDV